MNPCYCMARAAMGAYVKVLALGKFLKTIVVLKYHFHYLVIYQLPKVSPKSCMLQEMCEIYYCILVFSELADKGVNVNAVW